jgi:hypothetical protein
MFTAAVQQVDAMLAYNKSYLILDSKGLALCGLALCGNKKYIPAAINAYKRARAITRDAGVIGRVQRLFDVLAQADGAGILNRVREIAIGGK